MKLIIRTIIILSFLLFSITGCSKGNSDPVLPDNTGAAGPPALKMASGRNLIGVYEIHLRSDVSGADVRIKRTAQEHVNMAGEPDFYINAYYEPPINQENINDYNPYFGFRDYVICRLSIRLSNNSGVPLRDVRGIIMVNETALGLHNADGLTTAWGNGVDPNPFRYCEYIADSGSDMKTYQIEFNPAETTPNCETCNWPSEFDSYDEGGGKWHPEYDYIPVDNWVNFAVDASINDYCQDPYSITAAQAFGGSLDEPEIALTVNAYVHNEPQNWVESVSLILYDLPGYNGYYEGAWTHSGNSWTATIDDIPAQTHEGIYHGRIVATSHLPNPSDPYDDPNIMYKDIRLFVGDLDDMILHLFANPIGLIGDIEGEWTEREENVYKTDWAEIGGVINPDDDIYHLKIYYWVWDAQKVLFRQECGLLRIYADPNPSPQYPGLPLMVFCHQGKEVCLCEDGGYAPGGFPLYNQYKNNFAILIPRYRGNVLCFDGETTDEFDDETNSPADWDVDDVLTFLNVVIALEEDIAEEVNYQGDWDKLLDEGKVGIMGGSRGGSPAYLAKIRDSFYLGDQHKINRAIVTMGSVTDFFSGSIALACQIYIENDGYVCEPDPLYDPEDEFTYHYYYEDYNFFARLLEPYLQGKFLGENNDDVLKNARLRMLGASPKYFADPLLDYVQVHHGLEDNICRPAQTTDLDGIIGDHSEIHLYDGVGHGIGPADWDYPPTKQFGDWVDDWYDKIINGN
jgi:hypothetical protein